MELTQNRKNPKPQRMPDDLQNKTKQNKTKQKKTK
jgi:hypothetical protein